MNSLTPKTPETIYYTAVSAKLLKSYFGFLPTATYAHTFESDTPCSFIHWPPKKTKTLRNEPSLSTVTEVLQMTQLMEWIPQPQKAVYYSSDMISTTVVSDNFSTKSGSLHNNKSYCSIKSIKAPKLTQKKWCQTYSFLLKFWLSTIPAGERWALEWLVLEGRW